MFGMSGSGARGHRERLVELFHALDTAPFDVTPLRRSLHEVHTLTEAEAKDLLRLTLIELRNTGYRLAAFSRAKDPVEALTRARALDWLATARAILVDHSLN